MTMKKPLFALHLALTLVVITIPLMLQAAVYKHVDSEGRLIKYSDQPQHPGDKPLDMPKPSMEYKSEKAEKQPVPKRTITKEKNKEKQSEENSKAVVAYAAVAIVKPDNEEAIRANGGSFSVELASQPELDAKSGHRYVIMVDGKKHAESNNARLTLQNMERGAHSISAEIRDSSNNVLASSSSKTIYVLRATAR